MAKKLFIIAFMRNELIIAEDNYSKKKISQEDKFHKKMQLKII